MSILDEALALQKPKRQREIDTFYGGLSAKDRDDFATLVGANEVHATTVCKLAAEKGWGKLHPDVVRRARNEGWQPA